MRIFTVQFFPFIKRSIFLCLWWLNTSNGAALIAQDSSQVPSGFFLRAEFSTLSFSPDYYGSLFDQRIPGLGIGIGWRYPVDRVFSFSWSIDASRFQSDDRTEESYMRHRYYLLSFGLAIAADPLVKTSNRFVPRAELAATYAGLTGPSSVLNIAGDEDSPHKEFGGYGPFIILSLQPRVRMSHSITLVPAINITLATKAVFIFDEGHVGKFPRSTNYSLGVEFHAK